MNIRRNMNYNMFAVLECCRANQEVTQRLIAQETGLSLGSVNGALRELREAALLNESHQLTPQAFEALAPFKVDNAIIMAAGMSSRFAPISYDKPKGTLVVKDEVLIERQIKQLQQAGITNITVVVGYKKEEFFYLSDQFNVEILVNEEYAMRNNNSTIIRVADKLANTYICSSDDYFTENPFKQYEFGAYYAATYISGETDEYCLVTKGKDRRITGVTIGGANSWVMMGHTYWDKTFSTTFVNILRDSYDNPDTASKLWEDIYIDHLADLYMVEKQYPAGLIWEFDSIDEVKQFDPEFLNNIDSAIMDNICEVLSCSRHDICNVVPLKQGLTNLSFKFEVGEGAYVYRHPGFGTDEIISRKSETASQEIAFELGIDKTYIHESPEEGWKISHFVTDCVELDYHDWDQVARAMDMARKLHEAPVDSGFKFDIHEDTLNTLTLLDPSQRTSFKDFDELKLLAETLNEKAKAHGSKICLCHNDFYSPNFLVRGDEMQLIDWEYSGMSDYASDLAVFICCCDHYSYDDTLRVLELYFGRTLSEEELFHCVAYLSVVSFHWFIWALYKEACGDPVGELLYLWYRYTKDYGAKALEQAAELGF